MRNLTVLYDGSCDLCTGARAWIEHEAQYVPIRFIAAGSDDARRRFPALDHADTLREITAVDDTGAVYRGAKAWIMCLWAMPRYRHWAARLGGARPLPAAKEFIRWVGEHRQSLSVASKAWRTVAGLAS